MTRRAKIPPERREKYRALLAGGAPPDTAYCVSIAGLRCGAKTRKGTPCKAPVVWWRGSIRCKLHGGMSTGAKTPEGKARALSNLKQNSAK